MMMKEELLMPVRALLRQIEALLLSLPDEEYCKNLPVLSNASLGQHTRHIIEFFTELNKGYETGLVNYDNRSRDYNIERSRAVAIEQINTLIPALEKNDKILVLTVDYDKDHDCGQQVLTNYQRELVYNIEHMVHHMALLRIGVQAQSGIMLPDDFGVALSTIKYKKSCAQ